MFILMVRGARDGTFTQIINTTYYHILITSLVWKEQHKSQQPTKTQKQNPLYFIKRSMVYRQHTNT
jgi:hypothetical protein